MLVATIPCRSYSVESFPPYRLTAYDVLETLNATKDRPAVSEGEVHVVLLWHDEPSAKVLVEWVAGSKVMNTATAQAVEPKTRRTIHSLALLQHGGPNRKHLFRITLFDPSSGKKRSQYEVPMDVNFA